MDLLGVQCVTAITS